LEAPVPHLACHLNQSVGLKCFSKKHNWGWWFPQIFLYKLGIKGLASLSSNRDILSSSSSEESWSSSRAVPAVVSTALLVDGRVVLLLMLIWGVSLVSVMVIVCESCDGIVEAQEKTGAA